MAKNYMVLSGIIIKQGKSYRPGNVVELEEKNAKRFGDRIKEYEVTPNTDVNELDKANVDPNELSMDELKQIAERDGLQVEGTGKGGAIKKDDYVKAIENK